MIAGIENFIIKYDAEGILYQPASSDFFQMDADYIQQNVKVHTSVITGFKSLVDDGDYLFVKITIHNISRDDYEDIFKKISKKVVEFKLHGEYLNYTNMLVTECKPFYFKKSIYRDAIKLQMISQRKFELFKNEAFPFTFPLVLG